MKTKTYSAKPPADFSVSEFQCVNISAPTGAVDEHWIIPRPRPRRATLFTSRPPHQLDLNRDLTLTLTPFIG